MGQIAKILAIFGAILFALTGTTITMMFLERKSPIFYVFQTIEAILFIFFWLLVYLIIRKSLFSRYKQLYQKDIPGIFVSLVKFTIFSFAVLSIIVFVFDKSVFSIAALAGLMGAGITFALGELILDAFSGVILEIEGPLEIGDWVKLDPEKQGIVTEINWRTIVLETLDNTLIIVPHRDFTKGFTNFSKPDKSCWDVVEFTISALIPVDRVERILGGALKKSPYVYNHKADIFAHKVSPSGVTYQVHYMLSDQLYVRETRHAVISTVLEQLKLYDLSTSPYLGEYSMLMGKKERQKTPSLDLNKLLRQVSLLKTLPDESLNNIANQCTLRIFNKGDKIVTEGEKNQTLFLIAEGYVDISIHYENEVGIKQETQIFSLGPPDYFGEMALLLNEPRSATVTAAVNTLTFEVSQEGLKKALDKKPDLLKKLIQDAKFKKKQNKQKREELAKLKLEKIPPSKSIFAQLHDLFR